MKYQYLLYPIIPISNRKKDKSTQEDTPLALLVHVECEHILVNAFKPAIHAFISPGFKQPKF